MKIRTEKIDGVTHHYIETGRKVLLEEIATLKTERANLDAYNSNLNNDAITLRNTINEKDILLTNYQNQIEIDKQLLDQERQKVLKEQEEKKQLNIYLENYKKELDMQKKYVLEISSTHAKQEEATKKEVVFLRKKVLDNEEMLDILKQLLPKMKMSVDSFEAEDITKAFLGEEDLHNACEEVLEKQEISILGDEINQMIGYP